MLSNVVLFFFFYKEPTVITVLACMRVYVHFHDPEQEPAQLLVHLSAALETLLEKHLSLHDGRADTILMCLCVFSYCAVCQTLMHNI